MDIVISKRFSSILNYEKYYELSRFFVVQSAAEITFYIYVRTQNIGCQKLKQQKR